MTVISSQRFEGGIATDDKVGIDYSHAYSRALDFRKKPGQMSPLPGARDIGSNVVVDLIQQIVQVDNGNRYGLGDQGYFYQIKADNTVVTKAKLDNGAAGMLYRKDVDELYCSSLKTVSRYGKFTTGTLDMDVNKYGPSRSTSSSAYRTGGTIPYNLSPSLSEGEKLSITPDIEPLYSIKLVVTSKGTGDWTITFHDDANNTLGTKSIANASLPSSGQVEFVFSAPIRMLVKPNARTYHAHVTSSNGTGSIASTGNLEGADFEMWADRLISPNNGLHPIEQFLHYTVVGNERYLSVWEPLSEDPTNAEWQRHRLVFPPGYEVCGLAATDEYLVVACEKRSTDSDRTFQSGKLFFWDGAATSYNFFVDVPEGAPESPFTYQNIVYMIIGGALYVWPGGKTIVKVRTLLNTDTEFSGTTEDTRVYPNMMGVRRNILLMGYPSVTNVQTIEHGIYSWGTADKNFPFSFGYNYVMSTLTRTYDGSNAVRIGCVRSFGDELYFSWHDDSQTGAKYGLDLVDNNSDPAPNGSWERRIYDAGAVFKLKNAVRMKIVAKALPEGVTITPKYKIDRGSWILATDINSDGVAYGTTMTEGDTYNILEIQTRNHELQVGFDWTHTGTEPFAVTCVALEAELLAKEDAFSEVDG